MIATQSESWARIVAPTRRSARRLWSKKGSATSITVRLACNTGLAEPVVSLACSFGGTSLSREGFIRVPLPFVGNAIAISLLSEKELAMMGELLLFGVATHERIEVRPATIRFRSQHPTHALRFLLA